MPVRVLPLLVVIALFAWLTAMALLDVGYVGILMPHFHSWAGGQVLADLVIMCTLGCVWMVHDGRATGRSPWPFIVLTLVAGSFGPLSYLVWRQLRAGRG